MQGLLVIHILGAIATAGIITASIYSILKNISQNYKKLFYLIISISIIQVGSGLGLLITNNYETILGFCLGLGFYLSAIILIESVLFVRLRQLKTQQA